jgi:predicted lipoprotein with Yx(FWY)xxD motif/mono/diheme cytochrome c family protein
MISARMNRPLKVLLVSGAVLAVAVLSAACGTQKITVPKSNKALYEGAVIFNQRCGGCHTLDAAATHGSASNIKTRLLTNGPNFNLRCERPAIRVLYAIENGGFSGAIMPQNIVVGKEARDVALFVATYSGRKAQPSVDVTPCQKLPIGTVPPPGTAASVPPTTTTPTTPTTTTTTPAATTPAPKPKKKKPSKAKKVTATKPPAKKPSKAKKVTKPAATKPPAKKPAAKKPAAATGPKIATATIAGLGPVLVNAQGHTLYIFEPDNDKKVTCVGGCATIWPPAMVAIGTSAVASGAVKQSLVSSDPDPSGGQVITYAGWPLYTYVADSAAGAAGGQALNLNGGLWYVISPSGKVIKAKPQK